MPNKKVSGTSSNYYLVAFDADGNERDDPDGNERDNDPDGLMSQNILRVLSSEPLPITDVFIFSHGWLGDVPAAIQQYDKWTEKMLTFHGIFFR